MTYAFGFMLLALLAQARPAIALSLAFIMFYKIGDEIIFSMGTPFLKRYLLVDNTQLAWMSGLLGLVGSIVGTTIGGLWIKRTGLAPGHLAPDPVDEPQHPRLHLAGLGAPPGDRSWRASRPSASSTASSRSPRAWAMPC